MSNTCINSVHEWYNCFCNSHASMYTLRNGFLQMLRYCFSDPDHYAENREAIECLTYKPDGTGTLDIVAKGASDPSDTDHIPGIVLSFDNGISYSMPTISDITMRSLDHATFGVHSLGQATMVVKCRAYDADIACILSDMVALFMAGVKVKVMQAWGGWLHDYRLSRQTEPSLQQVTESDSSVVWYESSVAFNIDFEYNVSTVQESKRLKGSTVGSNVD